MKFQNVKKMGSGDVLSNDNPSNGIFSNDNSTIDAMDGNKQGKTFLSRIWIDIYLAYDSRVYLMLMRLKIKNAH